MPGFANCDVHHQLLCQKFNCFCRRRHTNVKTPTKTFLPICCWKNQRTADNIVNVSGLLKSRSYLDDSSHKLEPHTTQRTETANTAGCLFKTDMMCLQPACPTRRPGCVALCTQQAPDKGDHAPISCASLLSRFFTCNQHGPISGDSMALAYTLII